MEFVLENAQLRVTVSTLGAELRSVIRKCDGVEHLWQGDPAVWAGQAPVLFPFTGNLKDGHFFAKGGTYDGGHAMIFTDTDGQMYLSFHSPNAPTDTRKETPVFLAIREEEGRILWDEPKPMGE